MPIGRPRATWQVGAAHAKQADETSPSPFLALALRLPVLEKRKQLRAAAWQAQDVLKLWQQHASLLSWLLCRRKTGMPSLWEQGWQVSGGEQLAAQSSQCMCPPASLLRQGCEGPLSTLTPPGLVVSTG